MLKSSNGLLPASHLFQKKDILIVNKKETVGILLPILAHPSKKKQIEDLSKKFKLKLKVELV